MSSPSVASRRRSTAPHVSPANRILFVSQGRASRGVAMGHIRVEHALRAGLAGLPRPPRTDHVTVPAWSAFERLLVRPLPGVATRDFEALRWHLARGWRARKLIRQYI